MRLNDDRELIPIAEAEPVRWRPGERLNHLFEACCDANPRRTAVIASGMETTYAELDSRANRIARVLMSRGVRAGGRVGIHLDRSVHTYECLLAVLKAHAAFVPIDHSFPAERKLFIAKDASLSAILTTTELASSLGQAPCPVMVLDALEGEIADADPGRISPDELGHSTDEGLCYIIYTSGSTGNPKGVAVEHPSICNFVRVASEVYGIEPADRVYQGMITAFDFSIEEIWPALITGAAVVPGPRGGCCLGADLAAFLADNRVTVLCCVPTLLATLDRDIPSLRLILAGGEACPQSLVERWHRGGRRMLNTYGPTEATVTATWGELRAGKAVTIGRAMPTYTVYLLDENREPVPDGATGEICIAGIGVARGYVGRDELTGKCFIPDHFGTPGNPSGRIYCTGDLGRLRPDGEIEYLGRADTQVKIRGFRIELSEIESAVLEAEEVEKCVVSAWASEGVRELAAYVQVRACSTGLDRDALHRRLAGRLPAYMVPAYLEVLDEVPLLANGKADRKALPRPRSPRLASSSGEEAPPVGPYETKIASALEEVFGLERAGVEDDFFENLGGHSMLVARLISRLRRDPLMASLSLSDAYRHPTVRSLAGYAEGLAREGPREAAAEKAPAAPGPALPASSRRVWLCGIGQAASLYLSIALFSIPGLFIFDWMVDVFRADWTDYAAIAGLFLLGICLSLLLAVAAPVALKWALLGRVRPGAHPLWGWFFLRWWFVEKAMAAAPLGLITSTPLMNLWLRMMGARIGPDAVIETALLHVPDLIEIGGRTSVGANTHLFGYSIDGGMLCLAPVRLGRRCHIGSNSIVGPGSTMENGSWLGDQSLLAQGQSVPAGESWAGSPARRTARPDPEVEELAAMPDESPAGWRRMAAGFVFAAAAFVLGFLPFIVSIPGFAVMLTAYYGTGGAWFLLTAPVAALSFVVLLSLSVALLKRLILARMEPGAYCLLGGMHLRKWLVDRLMSMSLAMTNSLYATLYLPPFLRLLGVKIGRRSEISTISHINPNLLTIDDESFVADIATVGSSRTHNGWFTATRTHIGYRSFIGNAAFIPAGSAVSDNSLIGVLSVPPGREFGPGTTWLGSPSMNLPKRQESQEFPEELTYRPTPGLYARRLSYEFFRVTGPAALFSLAIAAALYAVITLLLDYGVLRAAIAMPVVMYAISAALTLFVALVKKALIWKYRPLVRPMWSSFVWRTELVTALYENVVVPSLLRSLTGTPFASPVLRLLGARIGRRCYLETTFLTEFDLVTVGDDCSIGQACSLQTHLFEDRVMKMSGLRVGDRCDIGPRAVVLYDSTLEDGSRLDALSLAMKGETLAAGCTWRGVPAIRCEGSWPDAMAREHEAAAGAPVSAAA